MPETKRAAPKNAAGTGRKVKKGKGTGVKGSAIAKGAGTSTSMSQVGRFLLNDGGGEWERAKSEPRSIAQGLLNPLTTKAFKGKGVLWELRRLDEELARTESKMQEIVSISADVPGHDVRCYLLRFKDGRRMLRWRRLGSHSTATDEEAVSIFEAYKEPRKSWYLQMNAYANKLTQHHRLVMARKRNLQKELPSAPLFARGVIHGFLPYFVQKRYETLTAELLA